MMAEHQERDRASHGMAAQNALVRAWRYRRDELGELFGIAFEDAGGRLRAARAHRPALASPVQAPDVEAAGVKVAHDLEVLFDELEETADKDAVLPRAGGEVTMSQACTAAGGEMTPLEAFGLQESPVQHRRR